MKRKNTMKSKKTILSLIALSLFFVTQPAYSALFTSLEQKTITIDRFENNQKLIALDGSIYEINSAELLKKAQTLTNQQAHVLYVKMGDKLILSDLKSAMEPPFRIPVKETTKNKSPN